MNREDSQIPKERFYSVVANVPRVPDGLLEYLRSVDENFSWECRENKKTNNRETVSLKRHEILSARRQRSKPVGVYPSERGGRSCTDACCSALSSDGGRPANPARAADVRVNDDYGNPEAPGPKDYGDSYTDENNNDEQQQQQ